MKKPAPPMYTPGERPVVFLDIDDVLCVHRTLNTRQVLAALAGNETVDATDVWQQVFHAAARENLRLLNDEFGPRYVISSSWTLHLSREQLCETFRQTSLGFVAENLHEFWCTPRDDDSYRLVEIEAWLDAHALLTPVPYLVIDDLVSGQSIVGSHIEDSAVLCDAWVGFTHPKLRSAQKILRCQLSSDVSAREQR
ncbi:HAD domain-containing protein [Duganella sp. LjRoot269]|uniref:HAD domain-containing protein n=1 Tax=Duganella sp. LjRoot269 TaxID=3342305 RepID=UPI003ECF317B